VPVHDEEHPQRLQESILCRAERNTNPFAENSMAYCRKIRMRIDPCKCQFWLRVRQ